MIIKIQTKKTLLKVNSVWNKKLSTCFNKFWFELSRRELPLDDANRELFRYQSDVEKVNYKELFVRLMKSSIKLENGHMFRTWQLSPIEINAVATYENVLATGEYLTICI